MTGDTFTHPDLTAVLAELTGATDRRGADDFWGCCPFHGERTPSFHVSNGQWHCFGACRTGGGALDLIMRVKGCDKRDASLWLTAQLGVPLRGSARHVSNIGKGEQSEIERNDIVSLAQRWLNLAGQPQRDRERSIVGGMIRDLLRLPMWSYRQWGRFLADLRGADEVSRVSTQFRVRRDDWTCLEPSVKPTPVPSDVARALDIAQDFFGIYVDQWRPLTEKRGIHDGTARRFGIGYAPAEDDLLTELLEHGVSWVTMMTADLLPPNSHAGEMRSRFRNRLMFPIHDHCGVLVAFAGRSGPTATKNAPKYLNSHSSPWYQRSSLLYGAHFAEPEILRTRSVVLVEGYFDVMQLHQAGQSNSVAICGAAVTVDQAKRLAGWDVDVTLCLDGDIPGIEGATRSAETLLGHGIWPRVILLDGAKDPDEWVRLGHGRILADEPAVDLLNWIPQERWHAIYSTMRDPFVARVLQHHFGFDDRTHLGGLRLVDRP